MKKNNKIQSILIFLVVLSVSADYTIAQGAAQGNLAAGAYHTAVILDDGSVKTWGSNSHGQLGQGIAGSPNSQGDEAGEMGDDLAKVELGTGRTAVRIAAGSYHTAVILDDGSVKVWGKNQNGQLGQGNRTQLGYYASDMGDNLTPVDLGTGKTAVAIAAGTEHTAVILNDGSVKAWGFNTYGQLGLGHTEHMGNDAGEMGDDLSAVDLGTGRTAVAIAAGNSITGVILDDGTVKVWGFNTAGVLGQEHYSNIGDDPNEMGDNLPAVDLGTGKTAVDIAIGGNHVVVLLNDGTIKAWGNNGNGELGQGRDDNQIGEEAGDMGDNLPTTNLPDGLTAIGVAAGYNHTIAIFNNGTVGVVGKNNYGQLGQGNTDDVGANTLDILYNGKFEDAELRWNDGEPDTELIERYYSKIQKDGIRPKTKATAIQIGKPVNIIKALRALEFTDGVVTTVTDNEMLDGMTIVGLNGFDCEMASGSVPAGVKKLIGDGIIKKDDKIVGILTGRQKEPLLPINYHNDPSNKFARPPKS